MKIRTNSKWMPEPIFVILLLSLIVCIVLDVVIRYSLIPDDWSLKLELSMELLGKSTILMVFTLLVMHTKTYAHVKDRQCNPTEFFITSLAFATLSIVMVADYESAVGCILFSICFFGTMFAGLAGGLMMGLVSSVFASVGIAVLNDEFAVVGIATLVATVSFTGLFAGAVRDVFKDDRYDTHVILFLSLVDAAVIEIYTLFLYGGEDNLYDLFHMSAVCVLLLGAITPFFYNMFKKSVKYRDFSKKSQDDLNIAHKIQMSAVPTNFPTSKTFRVSAMMEPAIDVGGDFYDVFTIKQNLIGIVIADVSDKGLPAALFMMRSKGVIKSIAMVENEPERILSVANKELCEHNDVGLFATAWVGIMDTDTGILHCSNAGHTVPYIRRSADGSFEQIKMKKGMMIGINEFAKYAYNEIQLNDGDALFLYTDGVNEAFNGLGEQYGHGRLENILNITKYDDPKVLIDSVREDIRSFAKNEAVSDDITMLCLMTDRSNTAVMTVAPEEEKLDDVIDFINDTLTSNGCSQKLAMKLDIAAEEAFVNICSYSSTKEDVTVLCRFTEGEAKITFADRGKRFNPVNREEKIIDEDVSNWTIGGFGIHMMKNLVDNLNYKYIGGRNVLTMWRKDVPDTPENEEKEA